jgi:hypothetical protein
LCELERKRGQVKGGSEGKSMYTLCTPGEWIAGGVVCEGAEEDEEKESVIEVLFFLFSASSFWSVCTVLS